MIAFREAYKTVTKNISPLSSEKVTLRNLLKRIVSEDIISLFDSPSSDVSLKDGYAIVSEDIEKASSDNPVRLALIGTQFAGSRKKIILGHGKAVRITSGAIIPEGADAVIPEEFTVNKNNIVEVLADAYRGRNILRKGDNFRKGETIISRGTLLMPPHIGLIASAGLKEINVFKSPIVTIIATGDEILKMGKVIRKGKIPASNLLTTSAWCHCFGMKTKNVIVGDSENEIKKAITSHISVSDCMITSGGAWKGEKDLVVQTFDKLGWEKIFHRVRMGPGKAIAFGFLDDKPIFCLPGGPTSNQISFLNLALPGLLLLNGRKEKPFPVLRVKLAEEVKGQTDWTKFIMGSFHIKENGTIFSPHNMRSRLQYLAKAEGMISIPEGAEILPSGSMVSVQVLKFPSTF